MEKFKIIDDKKEKLEQIKNIMPWVFDDGILNIRKLEKEFFELDYEEDSPLERYGLYWNGKSLAKNIANVDSFKSLYPNKNKSLNFDESENVIIYGDNLEVLKLLKLSYNSKVDVIYIDPPYNTGNDFVYKDTFGESLEEYKYRNNMIDDDKNHLTTNQRSDGRFHSKWLDMIYPRLLLSRQVLKEDGLIFISIDDNELPRLQLVCDEIFGENNFISMITWQKKSSGTSSDSKYMKNLNEYILVYSKNKSKVSLTKEPLNVNDGSYKFKDDYFERRGLYKTNSLDRAGLTWSEKLDYELIIDGVAYYPGGVTKEEWLKRKKNHAIKDWRWRWSKPKTEWGIKSGYVFTSEGKVYSKQYQYVDNSDQFKDRETPYSNLILNNEISGSTGTEELRELFDESKVFEHPKPIDLIKYFINLCKNKNALVLDFFAGSGSTGQAVMDLNNLDGGNRKYILVQVDEEIKNSEDYKDIIEVTTDRIKRAIDKNNYKDKGFKYFYVGPTNFLTLSNYYESDTKIENLKLSIMEQEKNIKNDIRPIDLVYEVGLRNNIFMLDQNIQECFNNEQKYYLVDRELLSAIFFFYPLKDKRFYGDIYIYIYSQWS